MSVRAKAMATLYRLKRVSKEGLQQAVNDGIITSAEYQQITGEAYA